MSQDDYRVYQSAIHLDKRTTCFIHAWNILILIRHEKHWMWGNWSEMTKKEHLIQNYQMGIKFKLIPKKSKL